MGEECEVAQHKLLANRCAPYWMADYWPCFHLGKNPVSINEKGGSIEWRFFTEIFQIIVIFFPP